MSSSKLISNKNSSPLSHKGSFSISSHSQSISRIAQISQNTQSITPTKQRPQNTASFQARHLFNLMNMTTEDPKNMSITSFPKSPLAKNVSFIQQRAESPARRSVQYDLQSSNQQYSLNRKSLIYNDSTINSDFSESMLQEDIRYLKHPNTSFKGQHKPQLSKEFSAKKLEEASFINNNNQEKACKSARVSKGGEPVNAMKPSAGVAKKTDVKPSDQSQKRGEVQRSRNDGKVVGYSTISPFKDKPMQGRNSISNSQMSMMTLKKGAETERNKEVIEPKPILRNSQTQNYHHGHSKSQISRSIMIESNAKDVSRNEGMDMKSLIHDNSYVQDSRDRKFILHSPKGGQDGGKTEESPLRSQNSLLVKKAMEIDLKPAVKQNKTLNHSRSQTSRRSILGMESVIKDVSRNEGMDMKSLIHDNSYVQDSRDKVNMKVSIPSPRGGANGMSNGNNDESPLQHVYNELLNKKFGGVPQRHSAATSTTVKNPSSPRNDRSEKKEKNSSTTENMYHSILDSILNKKKPATKKKLDNSELESVKKIPSTSTNTQEPVKSKSISLNIMKQVPKGVLVKKTDRKGSTNEPEPISDRKRHSRDLSATFDLTKSFHMIKTMGTVLVQDGVSERKETDFCTDRSKDYSILQSPIQPHPKSFKKSKSVMILRDSAAVTDKKFTRKRSNAVTASPFSPRGIRHGASFERSASVRRANKEEKMDIKSLKVRKENKEFVDLLNKISKNITAPETSELFGKEEEALVKDLADFIQAQELAAKNAKEHETETYEDRMGELEKKLSKVRAKIPSLQGLHLLGDSQEDGSPRDLDVSRETSKVSPRLLSMTNRSASLKKSSFMLESTKNGNKVKIEFEVSSVEDVQGSEPARSVVLEKGGIDAPEGGGPVTPKLGGEETHKIDFKEVMVAESKRLEAEEEKVLERMRNINKEDKTQNKKDLNNAQTNDNKNLLAIEIPVISFTQESTCPSLFTVALETPTTSLESNQQDNIQVPTPVTLGAIPQKSPVTISNIEAKLDSPLPSPDRAVLNPTEKLNALFLKPRASPSNDDNKTLVSSPQTNLAPSSLEPVRRPSNQSTHNPLLNIIKPVEEASPNKETPKLGALASLVFKTAQPSHSSSEAGHISLSTLVHIKKKLKPVYIEKLAPENLKETIYENIYDKEHPGVSFGDIHDLFENAPFKKPEAPVQQAQLAKKQLTCIVPDAKRAHNITILAMKFRKLSSKEFREAIINLDPEIMTPDTCSTLLPFCPLPEEIKACQDCKEPLEKLDTASQFMLNIYDIPQLGPRLRSMIFKNEFKERLGSVQESINSVKLGCDLLRSNVHFRVFLRLSLEVANTLNEGTARGSAVGIKPASLLSFDTVRSNKPGLTLLVYMVQKIYEQRPEILDFTDDFAGVNEATKINIEDPIRSLQEIKKEINQLRLQLEVCMDKKPQDVGFYNAFKEFYDSAAPAVTETEERANYAKNHYMETAKFLGEDDESLKKKTSIEFFKVFKHLADTVRKFKVEEEEKKKREARRNAALARSNKLAK